MTETPLSPLIKRACQCFALLVAISVVASFWSGGRWSFMSKRGIGSTDLSVVVDLPIPNGLRVRYAKVFSRDTNLIVANPNAPEYRREWKELSGDSVSDSVVFAFSTEPRLFGYQTKRGHYADALIVWYQKDERETFRVVTLPGNSEPGPWKVVVPMVEP